jgi:hypothetical protein
MHADREPPHQLFGVRVQFDQDAGPSAVDHRGKTVIGHKKWRIPQVPFRVALPAARWRAPPGLKLISLC